MKSIMNPLTTLNIHKINQIIRFFLLQKLIPLVHE